MPQEKGPSIRRGEVAFIFAIVIGLVIGFLIKRVRIGILIGLALGVFIVLSGWLRAMRK
ncbi:MAG TPA: hypothetical protein PLU37_03445 [Chitinophagaceae bacterium]|nr:hypothetical protein [Chitinophagaceae bacterium]HPG10559.1 hypothetical protein [Chitinophagaceae bacterium]HRX93986.1 hypothetical protein [Chitinophagaceae bacterium]